MEENEVKENFSHNLIFLRKSRNLTQLQLATELNYSDKSISKWECGETLPDIATFSCIANFFEVSVDELISRPIDKVKITTLKQFLIMLAAFGLTWLVGSVCFFIIELATTDVKAWITFFFVMPCSAIVLFIFAMLWFSYISRFVSLSLLIWSIAVLIHILLDEAISWYIYIIALVSDVLLLALFLIIYLDKRKKALRKNIK